MVQRRRILIADDDTEIRLGAADLLEPLGLDVIQAGDGSSALELLRANPVHLALLDYHMPGRTGLEVVQALREATLEIPCILWSGEADEGTVRYLLEVGASAFLRKPVRPDVLRSEVSRVLDHHWGPLG